MLVHHIGIAQRDGMLPSDVPPLMLLTSLLALLFGVPLAVGASGRKLLRQTMREQLGLLSGKAAPAAAPQFSAGKETTSSSAPSLHQRRD